MSSSTELPKDGKHRDEGHIKALGRIAASKACTFHTRAGSAARQVVIDGYKGTPLFDSPEHEKLGEGISITWDHDKTCKSSDINLRLTNGVSMTYSRLNSLAGDYYGTYDPICKGGTETEQLERFKKAFNLLDANKSTPAEIERIEATEKKYELDPLQAAKIAGNKEPPSKVYSEMDVEGMTCHWFKDTECREGAGYPGGPYPSYIGILLVNFDHFGHDAEIAYNTGHKWALTVAGNSSRDPAQLEYAYKINAFADHFLQDRFSAGHLRTPRRELHDETINLKSWGKYSLPIKDYCANLMHNEDSALGVNVTNGNGLTWTCCGDDYLLDLDKNGNVTETFTQARNAVQASVNEVYEAWDKQDPNLCSSHADYGAWKYAPILDCITCDKQPLAPLFRVNVDTKRLERRGKWFWDITDRTNSTSYTDDFDPLLTAGYAAYSGRWKYPMTLR